MPPKVKFTRQMVVDSALNLVRQNGAEALTARALAQELGSSVKPIFSVFENMDELKSEVIKSSNELYLTYIYKSMEDKTLPPYKASGLGYISFAKQEKELFKLLFMRDRTNENIDNDRKQIEPIIDLIIDKTGISREKAYEFHTEMWIYVHGIATMIATGFLNWDIDFINKALDDEFIGLKYKFCGGNVNECN